MPRMPGSKRSFYLHISKPTTHRLKFDDYFGRWGESTTDAAEKFGLSRGRISQDSILAHGSAY